MVRLPKLLDTLEELKQVDILNYYLITTKGKGLKQAEEQQVKYHVYKSDAKTGDIILSFLNLQLPNRFWRDTFRASKAKRKIRDNTSYAIGEFIKLMINKIPTVLTM